MNQRSVLVLVLVPAVFALGCSGSSNDTPKAGGGDSPDAGTRVTCQNDPIGIDSFVANLSKASATGKLRVFLVSSDPAPPAVGLNTWVLRVTDASGNALAGPPSVSPFMPYHNHGPSVVPSLSAQADGSYSVTNLDLFMPGVWQITIRAPAQDAGAPESVQFNFCITG